MSDIQFYGLTLLGLGAFWLVLGWIRSRILYRQMLRHLHDTFDWTEEDDQHVRVLGGIHDVEKDRWN